MAEDPNRPPDEFADTDEEESDDEPPADFYAVKSTRSRCSVSAEAYGDWNTKVSFVAPVISKSEEQTARLTRVLGDSFMFSALEPPDLAAVIGAMREIAVEPRNRLIQQGDDGDCLYVVETGRFECAIKDPETGAESYVRYCEAGDVFGELALLYNAPRAASVDSVEASVVWRLDRDTFSHIIKDAAQSKRMRHEEFLARVPVLQTLGQYERSQLADALIAEWFEDAKAVMTQGEIGNRFYVVEEGQADAWKDGEHVMTYQLGDYFGELALIRNQPRATTVMSTGRLKVLSCDSGSFKRLLNVDQLEQLATRYT